MSKFILATAVLGLLFACQPVSRPGHSHSTDHGGEGAVSYTQWTEQVELFVEFKPLAVGEVSSFAAHFTRLSNYQPISEGEVTVNLIVGEKGIRQTVDGPSSPGIFTPALKPTASGKGRLIFDLSAPGLSERIVIEDVPVFSRPEEAAAAVVAVEEKGIDFLKEQAWKIDLRVQRVAYGTLSEVIKTTGKILPIPGSEQEVAAPSSGIVVFAHQNLLPGRAVSQGEWLFSLVATGNPDDNLQAQLHEAEAAFAKAEAEYNRRKELRQKDAVSQKDFEESEMEYKAAKAAMDNLKLYLADGGRKVFAPAGGYIRKVGVAPGAFVETGATVLAITQNRKLQLVASLPQQYFGKLRQIKGVDFKLPYLGQLQSLTQYNGRLVSHGQSISEEEPFLAVYFELENNGNLLPGSLAELFLHTGEAQRALVIPRASLIEEYGSYFVVVQLAGELFEKRAVHIGIDNGHSVEVLQGLREGEMIVTQGAYQVKMASMAASLPAHGHTH